ncbi:unnamed protein product [Closterium sp. Naga37s-1]|nr:unnamed protein product [Closterium sp. Naga37s-1]
MHLHCTSSSPLPTFLLPHHFLASPAPATVHHLSLPGLTSLDLFPFLPLSPLLSLTHALRSSLFLPCSPLPAPQWWRACRGCPTPACTSPLRALAGRLPEAAAVLEGPGGGEQRGGEGQQEGAEAAQGGSQGGASAATRSSAIPEGSAVGGAGEGAGGRRGGAVWWKLVEVRLARAYLWDKADNASKFLEVALPMVSQSMWAIDKNERILAAFRAAHPWWRGWMRQLKALLGEQAREGKEGLYRGLKLRLPRGIACQLANRRRLARLAAEEAERQAALGEGRDAGEGEGGAGGEGAGRAGGGRGGIGTDSVRLQLEVNGLSDLGLKDVDEPALHEVPLPGIFSDDQQFALLLKVVQALLHEGRPMEAERLVETALSRNLPKPMRKQLQSAIVEEASGMLQFKVARAIISEQPHSIRGWSLFHSLTLRGTESNDRRAKFLQQMRMRHPACVAAVLVSGHHHALRGHMQGACREYLRAHRLQPHDPLICLCCGVALLNLSLGSRLRDRSQCVLQGMALLQQYAQLSGDTQHVLFGSLLRMSGSAFQLGSCVPPRGSAAPRRRPLQARSLLSHFTPAPCPDRAAGIENSQKQGSQ